MFTHLLVPLDGSRLAEAVLPTAARLAQILGAQVTLLHLVERNAPRTVHSEPHLTEPQAATAYLAAVAGRAFPPAARVDWHVHSAEITDVANAIAAHAAELGVDLIVLATHGRGGVKQWLFGSIAQQVIGRSRLPVLVIRPEPEGNPAFECRKLIIPLDGQPAHEGSLPVAGALARMCGAGLHLIACIPTLGTLKGEEAAAGKLMPGAAKALLELAEKNAEDYVQAKTGELRAQGLDVTAEVCRGDAAETISAAAERLGADLIVLGTHGKAGMDAFWSGSLTPKLSGRSHLPVLLVPVAG
jgi:nucleotide-binding universal stress UspA family protein